VDGEERPFLEVRGRDRGRVCRVCAVRPRRQKRDSDGELRGKEESEVEEAGP
jgi:hypothetical protein